MIVQMQQRGGTAAEWTTENPVLADREMGVETDTRKFKFGDGVTAWDTLAYAGGGTGGGEGSPGWTWRGQWSSSTAYVIRDAVQYQGRSFYALAASTNTAPPTTASSTSTWSLIADKGASGADGGAFVPSYANEVAGSMHKIVAASTAPRPSARTDIFFVWETSDGLAPVNAINGDDWFNAIEVPAS